MFETLDKCLLAGLGALSMTRERAEKIFDDYVKRGQAEKGAKEGFIKDAVAAADKTRSELEQLIDKQVEKAIGRLNLATREDIERLESKLDDAAKRTD
ncbi:MAG: phasin family protein [Phycisphaerae bacterium]|nr:phasin family protein [Phycisphaerae bacterium]